MRESKWLKPGAITTIILAFGCCALLTIQLLCKDENTKGGIATLRFNFQDLLPGKHTIPERGIIQSFRSGVETAAQGVATAIPGAVSQVQSAANAVVTAVPHAVDALPKNCSIGTKKFCVGLANNISCSNVPLNLTHVLSPDIESLFHLDYHGIEPLNKALAGATSAKLYHALIVGLLCAFAMGVVFVWYIISPFLWLSAILGSKSIRAAGFLIFGIVCAIPFIITTAILDILNSKLKELPSWIQVEEGEVGKLCQGGLFCVIIMATFGSLVSTML